MKNLFQNLLLAAICLLSTTAFTQVPTLNSYPSASAVIFLDFDGHKVEGTSWNTSGPIFCAASNLSAAQITEIFNRVSEDYRPFNINVTTDSTKYWSAPAAQRMRVILTTTSSWYGNSGGVAYINSFKWGDNTPCFVFTALLNYNTKNISEATAHEAGHTLGLRHQSSYNDACGKISDYNPGVGDGEIGWAPIMGVSYYRNFTLWHNGPNTYGCSNYQSDLSIITSTTNGFGYRPDDHGNDRASATTTSFVNNQFTVSGVISKADDVDIFKFTIHNASRFQLDAIPYNVGTGNTGSDLDLQVELLNATNTVIGTYNPGFNLHSLVDTILSPGDYYLRIDGIGNQYSTDYASLGSFSLQASSNIVTPLPLHKLELKGNSENNKHKLNWIVNADEEIARQVIEVSSNGRDFSAVAQPENTDRSFVYIPSTNGVLQYRLNMLFNNGRQNYSNIIALRNGIIAKPQLITNVIAGSSLMITSPATFTYTITDYNGKLVGKGQVTKGSSTVSTSFMSAGMYIITFSNNNENFVEKFIKQ